MKRKLFLSCSLSMLLSSSMVWAQPPQSNTKAPANKAKQPAPDRAKPAVPDKTKPALRSAPDRPAPARRSAPAKRSAPTTRASVPTTRPMRMLDVTSTPGQDRNIIPDQGSYLNTLVKSGSIRVCIRTDIPPFGYFSGVRLRGFDVALAREVVTALGIRFQKPLQIRWVVVQAKARIKSLVEGRCDMAVAAFSVTDERKKKVAFSSVYIQTRKVVLARLLSDPTKKPEQPLVAYVRGTTTKKDTVKNAQMVSFYTYDDILDTMKKGMVDYVVTDYPTGLYLVGHADRYIVSRVLDQEENYGIGVHKGHTKLLNAINQILTSFAKNGRLAYLKRTHIR